MTLGLYLLRQLVTALAFVLGGLAFVVFPAITVSAVHKLQGVGVEALLGYLPLVALDLVPYMVPVGFLLAVVVTFGRLASDNEWTAIHMAGIHPLRTLLPGLLVALVLSLTTAWMLGTLSPEARARQRTYRRDAVRQALTTLYPGQTRISVDDFHLDAVSREGNVFRDVLVFLPPDEERESLRLVASEARLGFQSDVLRLELVNARWVQGGQEVDMERPAVDLPLEALVEPGTDEVTNPRYWTSEAIRARLPHETDEPRLRLLRYEQQRRLSISAVYFVFLVLGAPTGIGLRRGSQLGAMAVAVGYAIVYYVVSLRLGQSLALQGKLHPVIAAWWTTAAGLLAGAFLLVRAVRR